MTPRRVFRMGSHVTCLETIYGYRETTSRSRETGSYLDFVDAQTKSADQLLRRLYSLECL